MALPDPQKSANRNTTVLVVEDDAVLNELVGAYVKLAGFQVRSALDGTSALAQAVQSAPSLVILDVMLPDIDGFEVCRRLKQNPATAAVPVIMLTALSTADAREQGLKCGAAEYLNKPFDPEKLMSVLQSHARR